MNSTKLKQCSQCKEEKPHTPKYFEYRSKREGRLRGTCRVCRYKRNTKGKPHLKFICTFCKKTYHAKRRERNKYCSRECFFKEHTLNAEVNTQLRRLVNELSKIKDVICPECRQVFRTNRRSMHCSEDCRRESGRRRSRQAKEDGFKQELRKCRNCSKAFLTEYNRFSQFFCTEQCRKERVKEHRRVSKYNRRKRVRKVYVDQVVPRKIFERDGFKCKLCGGTLQMDKQVPHPKAPTIDHIIPLSKGGYHGQGNVQAAHFICNSRKGDGHFVKESGQLLLF